MQIATHRTDATLTLALSGRLDGITAAVFTEALERAMQEEGVQVLVLLQLITIYVLMFAKPKSYCIFNAEVWTYYYFLRSQAM